MKHRLLSISILAALCLLSVSCNKEKDYASLLVGIIGKTKCTKMKNEMYIFFDYFRAA